MHPFCGSQISQNLTHFHYDKLHHPTLHSENIPSQRLAHICFIFRPSPLTENFSAIRFPWIIIGLARERGKGRKGSSHRYFEIAFSFIEGWGNIQWCLGAKLLALCLELNPGLCSQEAMCSVKDLSQDYDLYSYIRSLYLAPVQSLQPCFEVEV